MLSKSARRSLGAAAFLALAATGQGAFAGPSIVGPPARAHAAPAENGLVRVQSAVGFDETVARLQQSVAAKGIRFFDDIDQAKLAAEVGIVLRPSHLLIFGNPPLGIKFLTSNPNAGLDWPVRMLVTQDADGKVWIAYTDFDWIARRYAIADRDADFKMASEVAASIAASATTP